LLFLAFSWNKKKIVYVIAICVKYIVFVELLEIEMLNSFFFSFLRYGGKAFY